MCNRYSISKKQVRLESKLGELQIELDPRFNIAPTQEAPVARLRDGGLRLDSLVWGLEGFQGQLVMNARAETAHEKRLFREAWEQRHCLVPSDGFYEWRDTPEGKQPYRFVRRDRELFWMAGLWTAGRFTILTRDAAGCVQSMHDRMPVILGPATLDWWIECARPPACAELVENAADTADLECYPVTRAMSNARHATPDCIEPFTLAQGELLL
jgi:putative SOS response-associated peptidase YedK